MQEKRKWNRVTRILPILKGKQKQNGPLSLEIICSEAHDYLAYLIQDITNWFSNKYSFKKEDEFLLCLNSYLGLKLISCGIALFGLSCPPMFTKNQLLFCLPLLFSVSFPLPNQTTKLMFSHYLRITKIQFSFFLYYFFMY